MHERCKVAALLNLKSIILRTATLSGSLRARQLGAELLGHVFSFSVDYVPFAVREASQRFR